MSGTPVDKPHEGGRPVATSQRQKDAEQQKRKPEKSKVLERSKTAGNQSVESPGGSVATSQQGEPEEDAAGDDLRATWVQIEGLNEAMANFVGYYNEDDAANRDIPLGALKRAYKDSISLVRRLEGLLMDAERAQKGRRKAKAPSPAPSGRRGGRHAKPTARQRAAPAAGTPGRGTPVPLRAARPGA